MVEGPRALLTERERAAIRGDEDVDDNMRSTLIARVRRKLKTNLSEDVNILRQHNDELAGLLREFVCEEPVEERTENLEQELDELRDLVEELSEQVDEHDARLAEIDGESEAEGESGQPEGGG